MFIFTEIFTLEDNFFIKSPLRIHTCTKENKITNQIEIEQHLLHCLLYTELVFLYLLIMVLPKVYALVQIFSVAIQIFILW